MLFGSLANSLIHPLGSHDSSIRFHASSKVFCLTRFTEGRFMLLTSSGVAPRLLARIGARSERLQRPCARRCLGVSWESARTDTPGSGCGHVLQLEENWPERMARYPCAIMSTTKRAGSSPRTPTGVKSAICCRFDVAGKGEYRQIDHQQLRPCRLQRGDVTLLYACPCGLQFPRPRRSDRDDRPSLDVCQRR